jgi:antitoxin (DNA-binding transcriptional repressor) of toxin-antitoxin stability system
MNMIEKVISVAELRTHLSACLRRVKEGERWTVIERGRPVAILGPCPSQGDELDRLAAEGAVRLGRGLLPSDFWDLPQPEDLADSVRRAVQEERLEGW